jgi:hypothetical protein
MNINNDKKNWGGLIYENEEEILNYLEILLNNEIIWKEKQLNSFNIINTLFNENDLNNKFFNLLNDKLLNLNKLRKIDFFQNILNNSCKNNIFF